MVFTGLSCRARSHLVRLQEAKQRLTAAVAVIFLATGLVLPIAAIARESQPSAPVALASLPSEAQATYRAIRNGGPFRYSKDGIVFGNRERLLPRKARGFYREYTVKTPGSRDRGARRIVCGGPVPVEPDACYYTEDHYASFRLIAQ